MAENWIKIKESLYKGAFLRNEKRGSSSESSSNRDWAEGELFRQEPLSIEIRNGTLETGNWTEVGEDGRLEMGNGKWERGKMDIGHWTWVILKVQKSDYKCWHSIISSIFMWKIIMTPGMF